MNNAPLIAWGKAWLGMAVLLLGLLSGGSAQAQAENLAPATAQLAAAGPLSGIMAVAGGGAHTCALTTGGGVKCWGDNRAGQLGDGTTTGNTMPADVSGLTAGVQAIVAGSLHTCALTAGGGVKCWGYNTFGQLGDGTTDERHTPVDVSGLTSGVQAIAAGSLHTCALTTGGGVKCWGDNNYGQLGDGTLDERHTPVDATDLANDVQAIMTGGYYTCAQTTGGVKCWGDNQYGQLGDGTTTKRLTPGDVLGLTGNVQMVAAGDEHTCALTGMGSLQCWGHNIYGQLGDATTEDRLTPVDISGLASDVQMVAAGKSHTCALTTNGGVKCWGYNGAGQLGDGTATNRSTPVDVTGLTGGMRVLAAGDDHTCALTAGGRVKCWGYNGAGQLGDGATTDRSTPVSVTSLASDVQAIAAGGGHACALTTGGGLKCWGWNTFGQLGDGATADHWAPADVTGLTSGVQAIAAGNGHTCALTTGGGVKCWGWNFYSQLGDGTTVDHWVPADVSTLTSGVQAVAAGNGHTCALTTGGGVKCWGDNQYGQLGDGTTTGRSTPVSVTGLANNVQAISAGWEHTCALTTGGGVLCWGNNDQGRLGDGTEDDRWTPVDVSGLTSGVRALAAGRLHTCAVTTAGSVKCWGDNQFGQLGNNATDGRLTPVNVSGLTNGGQMIAAGNGHTCALTSAGGVQCWGDNDSGQVGDGTQTDRLAPVAVTGLTSTVQAVTIGIYHTCALTAGGGVLCWGDNNLGQLGINPGWAPVNVVDPNSPPDAAAQITSSPVITAVVGQPYTYAVAATGVPTPTLGLVTGPAAMTINATSGIIQWTPTQAGSFSVTVRAENGVQPPAQQSFTIVVSEPVAKGTNLYLPLVNR